MKYLFICLILLPVFSLAQQITKADSEADRQIIKDALTRKSNKHILVDNVIPDKETAVAVAEGILFRVYGKDHIVGERPYSVNLIDGYWILCGTLPQSPGELVMGEHF